MANIDKITAIVKKYYTEWEKNPKRLENGYQYEQTYADMMQIVEQEVFALSVGKVSVDRNKKKNSLPDSEK
jgi:hypothetical protein